MNTSINASGTSSNSQFQHTYANYPTSDNSISHVQSTQQYAINVNRRRAESPDPFDTSRAFNLSPATRYYSHVSLEQAIKPIAADINSTNSKNIYKGTSSTNSSVLNTNDILETSPVKKLDAKFIAELEKSLGVKEANANSSDINKTLLINKKSVINDTNNFIPPLRPPPAIPSSSNRSQHKPSNIQSISSTSAIGNFSPSPLYAPLPSTWQSTIHNSWSSQQSLNPNKSVNLHTDNYISTNAIEQYSNVNNCDKTLSCVNSSVNLPCGGTNSTRSSYSTCLPISTTTTISSPDINSRYINGFLNTSSNTNTSCSLNTAGSINKTLNESDSAFSKMWINSSKNYSSNTSSTSPLINTVTANISSNDCNESNFLVNGYSTNSSSSLPHQYDPVEPSWSKYQYGIVSSSSSQYQTSTSIINPSSSSSTSSRYNCMMSGNLPKKQLSADMVSHYII